MGFSIIPRIRINSVLQLTPEFLLSRGISLLMLDLDNTLAPYSGSKPSEEIFRWKERMNEAGVTLFIVSKVNVACGEGEGYAAEQFAGITVAVKPSEAPKCVRCWAHNEHVGEDAEHPELCPRCLKAIREA